MRELVGASEVAVFWDHTLATVCADHPILGGPSNGEDCGMSHGRAFAACFFLLVVVAGAYIALAAH